jgi:sec-independent protein translocase protein TatC
MQLSDKTSKSQKKNELLAQPLDKHLRELKNRVIVSLIAFIIATCICYCFAQEIYAFLLAPLEEIYRQSGQTRHLIFTNLTEAFFVHLRLSCFAGFALAFPIIASQLYSFIAPGLYAAERRALIPYLLVAPLLFLLGAALVYYFVMPVAWRFFLSFEVPLGSSEGIPILLEARVSEYLSLVTSLVISFGVAFQLPIILSLLARTGLITSRFLVDKRRHAIVLIFIIAAILTPPDVFSQIALAIPLLILYEISIWLCKRVEKTRRKQKAMLVDRGLEEDA